MRAARVLVDALRPDAAFGRCRDTIRRGGVIAYPTDTFYGLGADPRNAEAVRRLFTLKERRMDQPVLLLIASAAEVGNWAADVTPLALSLMERFWPGPLTIVFPARSGVLPELTAGTGSIGLRVPGNELTRALLRFLGCPLTGTSANRAGGASPQDADQALAAVGDRVDLILDSGPAAGGLPSTVVDARGVAPLVLRAGAIAARDIEKAAADRG